MKRNYGLDLLKIIACFSVVILHVAGRRDGVFDRIIYYLGGSAVPIFFMVNGYLLLNKDTITYSYIFKKIYNILFIVVSWNLLLTLIKFIVKGDINNFFIDSLKNLLQIGYFYQFWFFGALIIIYIFLPILHKKFMNNKFSLVLVLCAISISLLVDVLSIVRGSMKLSIVQENIIQTFRIWTWFSYFMLGGILGKRDILAIINSRISLKNNLIFFICSTILVVVYQLIIGPIVYGVWNAEYFYDNLITYLWVISLFILINRLDWNTGRVFELLSSNTIGIYIIHTTIINIIVRIYDFNTISLLVIVLFLSILVSYILNNIPVVKRMIKL